MDILEKLEAQYKKNKNIVKGIACLTIGTVIGMWVYGKYKQSKIDKVMDDGMNVKKSIEELSKEVNNIKKEIE